MFRFLRFVSFLAALSGAAGAVEEASFSRDVLPLLSENCFACHGQDEGHRKGDLRLDTREGALAALKPGKPEESEMIARIVTTDEDEVMPPPESHKKPLPPEQTALLRRWISQGAPWGRHWSLEKPVKLPASGHPVDFFVNDRLSKEGWQPNGEAQRHTLIRRLSFDLTGLPPTPEELHAFFTDRSPDAYERLVQRLLDSPHFGERMAMWWLDAARYSDTDGFQSDANRTNWPWRDYVVAAFNANMPFDQFTLEQFAGDLLPDATPEQRIATCFHRNHMTNGEGGRDKEESRIDYVLDRVNSIGTVWLGLTLGCVQCHSHKFDPITMTDYYGMAAFFNSIDEDGAAGTGAKPYLGYQSPMARRAVDEARLLVAERKPLEASARRTAEKPFRAWLAEQNARVRGGFAAWQVLRGRLESQEGTKLAQEADGTVQAGGPNPKQDDYRLISTVELPRITGLRLEVLPHRSSTGGGLSRGASGEFILTDIKVQVRRRGSSQVRDIAVAGAVADYEAGKSAVREYGSVKGVLDDDPRNGWTTQGAKKTEPRTAVFALKTPLDLERDEELVFELLHRSTAGDANIRRFRVSATDQPGPAVREIKPAPLEELAAARVMDLSKIAPALRERLFGQFLEDHEPYQRAKAAVDRASAQLKEAEAAAGKLNVMVLQERKQPRDTHILVRGVWDKKGEKVSHSVPASVAPWPEGLARDRRGLAKWITSRENPLTARVLVNHLWQMCFGAGLVRTPDDFGVQGQRPSHPELLDWLAVDLMDSGWDVKAMLRRIVTSAAYRRDSRAPAEAVARDPQNRLLARGPRFRLPSWMLRDSALRYAGLLNPALGGPPVRPYQPEGVWEENFMGRFTYEPSEGAAQYRRTLYAFWRRSIAPTFLFDNAQRRVCEVTMTRTNTPLQALTLMNDQTMMEASRALAKLMLATKPEKRLQLLCEAVLSRSPSEKERSVLQRELERALDHYRGHPEDARKLNATPDLAAHALVTSLVLNLDEAITHE